jgi:hypothetical protein
MRFPAFLIAATASAALLAACGGSAEHPFNDPDPSGRAASVTVSASTVAAFNGVYSTTDLLLNDVEKVNPIGGDPETCRFEFSGLTQTPGGLVMGGGDVRYIPDSPEVRTLFVAISSSEYRLQQQPGATVDRANNRIVLTNAVLTSTSGNGNVITLNGAIPMRTDTGPRPTGC